MSDPGLALCRPEPRAIPHQMLTQPACGDFAAFPSRYLHHSWRTTLFGYPIGDAVWSAPTAHEHLSAHIKRALNLPDLRVSDLSSPAWAIAMLASEPLERFTRHVGVVAMSATIRSAIDRRSMQAIVDQIGPALYQFALQRASLICPAPINIADLLGTPIDAQAIGSQLQHAGRRLTQHYLDQCDPALWARAQLKLTFLTEDHTPAPAAPIADALVCRIVLGVKREIQ